MIPNPQALWLDNPERGSNALGRERTERTVEALEDRADGLIARPQDNHTR